MIQIFVIPSEVEKSLTSQKIVRDPSTLLRMTGKKIASGKREYKGAFAAFA